MKKRKGFTLLELLLVIAIIGIAIVSLTAFYLNSQSKARDNRRKADLQAIAFALEKYYDANKKYPYCLSCSDSPNPADQPWIPGLTSTYTENSNNFLPFDPKRTTGLRYYYYGTNDVLDTDGTTHIAKKYILWAWLENDNDPEIYTKSTAKCNYPALNAPSRPGGTHNYCVTSPIPCGTSTSTPIHCV